MASRWRHLLYNRINFHWYRNIIIFFIEPSAASSCATTCFFIWQISSHYHKIWFAWQPQIEISILHQKLPNKNWIFSFWFPESVAGCSVTHMKAIAFKRQAIEPLGGERSEVRGAFKVSVHQTFARLRDVPRMSITIFDDRIALIWLVHCFLYSDWCLTFTDKIPLCPPVLVDRIRSVESM